MRAMTLVLMLCAVLIPSRTAAQERRTGFSDEQWRHWAVKVGAAAGTYGTMRTLDVDPQVSAFIATAAPTVVGKLLYMPKGLSEDPTRRWPSREFVAKDIAGELCVQSAPLWLKLALGGQKEDRVLRSALAIGGYGLAVLTCARTLEVR